MPGDGPAGLAERSRYADRDDHLVLTLALRAGPAARGPGGGSCRLAHDQELLLRGSRRLADAQARFGIGMNGRFPDHLVSAVTDRAQIGELSAALANTARKDWMTLENLHTEMPLTEDFAQPPLPASGGQVRCRSIYEASAMDDPPAGASSRPARKPGNTHGCCRKCR